MITFRTQFQYEMSASLPFIIIIITNNGPDVHELI